MNKIRIRRLVSMGVIALSACDSSDTSGPEHSADSLLESLVTLDVASVAGDAFIEDVADLWLDFDVGLGDQFEASANQVSHESSHVRTVTKTFYDAEGNEQEAYDKVTTASVHVVSEVSRDRSRENESGTKSFSSSTLRTRDKTITGLEGDETTRTANGTGTQSKSRSRHSDEKGDRNYDMTGTTVISDVVHGIPKWKNPYPLSGTITRDITAVIVNGRNGNETRTKHVAITFDGTHLAHFTVNGELFEVDLSIRGKRNPVRKGSSKGPYSKAGNK